MIGGSTAGEPRLQVRTCCCGSPISVTWGRGLAGLDPVKLRLGGVAPSLGSGYADMLMMALYRGDSMSFIAVSARVPVQDQPLSSATVAMASSKPSNLRVA